MLITRKVWYDLQRELYHLNKNDLYQEESGWCRYPNANEQGKQLRKTDEEPETPLHRSPQTLIQRRNDARFRPCVHRIVQNSFTTESFKSHAALKTIRCF